MKSTFWITEHSFQFKFYANEHIKADTNTIEIYIFYFHTQTHTVSRTVTMQDVKQFAYLFISK